jgi:hypothetical protein
MTDKVQKIREEVARLKSNLIHGACASQIAMETRCKEEAYDEVISLLDSLQEEPVSEDLEEAAQEYVTKEGYLAGLHYNSMVRSFKAGAKWYASHNTKKLPENLLLAARKASIDMCDIDDRYLDEYPYSPIAEQKFIEGANWQKKQDQETIELAEDHAMLAGMEKMKEEMMKGAVEGYVTLTMTGVPTVVATIPEGKYNFDDKVKLIIILEEHETF